MNIILAQQIAPPLERLHGIRDRFVEGGSAGGVLAALGAVILLILLVYLAVALKRRETRVESRPDRLFEDLLREVVHSPQQRHLLRRIAGDLKLPHPAVLLMSTDIFEKHVQEWLGKSEVPGVKRELSALLATVKRASTIPQL